MRLVSAIVVAAAAGTLAAGCGSNRTEVRTVTAGGKTVAAGSGGQRIYGQVRSLVRSGGHYVLRFDPAWFLSGVTANVASAEDNGTHCRPSTCPPVPDDNYVVDESHRVLTFLVPDGVRGTVLVTGQSTGSFPTATITAAGLARIVAGTSALKLLEPLASGVWLLVRGDTVRGFSQQYRP